MRSRAFPFLMRVAWVSSVSALFVLGPVGCGGEDKSSTTPGQLPPEATQANKSMEDFMKTQKKK